MMADHVHRLGPDESRFMHQFINMSMDDRWLNRSPELMRDTFHWFRGEGFHLIIEDMRARSGEPCIVEGFRLLPDLLKPLLIDTSQAVWLLPTSGFRQSTFEARRLLTEGFISKTSDPPRAHLNLMRRDALFTDRLRDQTQDLHLYSIEVVPSLFEDALTQRIAESFGW